jgi:hypothetical protein
MYANLARCAVVSVRQRRSRPSTWVVSLPDAPAPACIRRINPAIARATCFCVLVGNFAHGRGGHFLPAGGARMPGAGVAETQRVLEGCVGPSPITSSARRARLAFKCRVNGIRARKPIRGTADQTIFADFYIEAINESARWRDHTLSRRGRPHRS